MARMTVVSKKCPQSHRCPMAMACPQGAVSQTDMFSLPVVDKDKCVLCGECVRLCPKGAFEIENDF
jgi:Fe-S-cluster-containing hydrogenase component 2